MPVPATPRLVLVFEPGIGPPISLAAWGLPNDQRVEVTPGVPGIETALDFTHDYEPQEGPAIPPMAVTSVFGRVGAVVAQLGDYVATLVSNDSGVAGATVAAALDNLDAAIGALAAALAGLQASGVGNDSGVAGATVADALDNLDAAIGALAAALAGLQASGVGNDSGVAGATVADALNTLDALVAALAVAVQRPAFLHWGSNSVSATTTTRYMPPGYDSALASLTPLQYRAPAACMLRNLHVRHNVPSGNGLPIVYTIRVNGVATLLSASLASTGTDASDLVDTIAVAAGDLIDLQVTKAASVGTSPTDVIAILEVAAP